MRIPSSAVLALAAVLATAAPLRAQQADWQNSVSFSPILALFEIIVADYERAVGDEATLGLGLGYWNYNPGDNDGMEGAQDGDASYLALDLKGRFYPDRAFKGIEFGVSLGLARVSFVDDETLEESDATGLAYGFEVGRGWLLGDSERWFLGAAAGAKRFWFGEEDNDLPEVMPTGRLNVGIAF